MKYLDGSMRDVVLLIVLLAVFVLLAYWLITARGRGGYAQIEIFYDSGEHEIYKNVRFYRAYPKRGYWIIRAKNYELFLTLENVRHIAVIDQGGEV